MPQLPAVSVLIVAYQSGPDLGRCLAALARQTFDDFEVVLVDNASTDGAVEAVSPSDRLRLIRSETNIGFAAGNNRAAAAARGRYLVTLNPDAFPAPDWLAALVATVERHPRAGSVGSIQRMAGAPWILDGVGDPYHVTGAAWRGGRGGPVMPEIEGETFGVCAAAALYRREAFESVGGFCERLFCYYEDVDLAIRLRLQGWIAVVSPSAEVDHVGSGSAPSGFVLRYATRNRIWVYLRGMPGPLLAFGLPLAVAIWFGGVVVGIGRGQATARLSAIGEAVRGLPATLAERRDIQAARKVPWPVLAAALSWSPMRYWRRGTDLRPVEALPALVPEPDIDNPRIVAVIVSYQPDDILDAVLTAALQQCDQVVVVDNGSGETVLRALRDRSRDSGGRLELVCNGENLGLATAQNQGIRRARKAGADWILLLDDDSVPADGMIAEMLGAWRTCADRDRVGMLAPRLEGERNSLKQHLLTARGRYALTRTPMTAGAVARHAVFAIASGSLIRSAVVEVTGGMADRFFIDYVDLEFSLRLRRAGFEIVGVGDAVLHHRLGELRETRVLGRRMALNTHSASRRFYIHRNRVRVWRRYGTGLPGWLAFDVAAAVYDVWKAVVYEDDKRAKLTAMARGFVAGWQR